MSEPPPIADLSAADLRVGLSAELVRAVSAADLDAFASVSGDFNPLHVDEDHARETSFGGRIAHGALMVALASALVGTRLPGRRVLVTGFNARFSRPVRVPTTLRLLGEIVAWNPGLHTGRLAIRITHVGESDLLAEIGVSFTLHEATAHETAPSVRTDSRHERSRRILVTGASGGLGRSIVRALEADYEIVTTGRQSDAAAHGPHIPLDLAEVGWQTRLESALGDSPLYAVIHAAWPGAPRGGLLRGDGEALRHQLSFGTEIPVGLARVLAHRVGAHGGRLIAVGSQAAHSQNLRLANYVLGKSVLETTISILARELAPLRIACNVVSPGFIPIGINAGASEREHAQERAAIPMGRLCSEEDVMAAIRYLLDPASEFHTGGVVALWGGAR